MIKDNSRKPANPVHNNDGVLVGSGLTKREAIAKDLPHIEVEFGGLGTMCKFIGVDTVPESIDEILSVTFATEARIRVMRADALLKELDK